MMASKSFLILEGNFSASPSSISTKTNWNLCIICQAETPEDLNCPALSNRKDVGSGYKSIAAHLCRFKELGLLPRTLQLERLDDGGGIEETLTKQKASWHPSCRAQYNTTKLKRAEKRSIKSDIYNCDSSSEKRTRAQTEIYHDHNQETCFFCGKEGDDSKKLHKAATFQIDQQVRRAAALVKDTELLGKLSAGDMVALDAVYHAQCLVTLYNRARKESQVMNNEDSSERALAGIVFAELVTYIEDSRAKSDESPIFKLADLVSLYQSRMQQLGVQTEQRIHSTRLKERLLSHIPTLQAHRSGRDVLLAFQDDVGDALALMCLQDDDDQGILLAKSAKLVREKLFSDNQPFNGTFTSSSKNESVPEVLVALISMILEGPGIKEQTQEIALSAARSIAELVKYNAVKHKRSQAHVTEKSSRHAVHQETPLPIYLGLLVHAETRKKGMIEKLHNLGLSISYDRVLCLASEMGNSVVESYRLDGVVCPKSLRRYVFTTAAVDNIDHNPSSTTAKDSFHGTSISILQHQGSENEGEALGGIFISGASRSKSVGHLPSYYSHVPPVDSNVKGTAIPQGHISSTEYHEAVYSGAQIHAREEMNWLDYIASKISKEEDDSSTFGFSWSHFHASKQPQVLKEITRTALLPLFHESAHTVAMIRHSIDVTRQVIDHLNPYQTPVLTFDQPLYALAKQIQWKWPQNYGEDQFFAMLGGLHIEMAYQKAIGDWLQGSGWVSVIEQASIASSGTAESFLKASHLSRTRRMHQVSAAALHLAKLHAYEEYCNSTSAGNEDPQSIEEWQRGKEANVPQFKYWNTVLEMELLLNILVRSLRSSDYQMYIDSLVEIASWFFAMNHTNYARWLPVHIRDLKQLGAHHQAVEDAFKAGKFTVKKTQRRFSAIPIDQAHEQNNKIIKGDGGAVGLTDNPSALRRWMVAGPESSNESSEAIPVFKLSDIKYLYSQRLKEYASPDSYTRVEKEETSSLLSKKKSDLPFIEHVNRTTKRMKFVCHLQQKSSGSKYFNMMSLVTLISMIIGGTDITDNVATAESKIALTISQLIKFNVVKHKRRKAKEIDSLRHSKELETPFPLYTGLLIHAKTRKKGIVNTFAQKGLSVSYERVQDVQLNVTKQLCKKYQEDGFVCPPNLKEGLFTTAAVDNIDHNPSSTTAVKSFHGTSISIFQHPEIALEPMQTDLKADLEDSSTKIELPESYTTLSPTKTKAEEEYSLQTVNWNNESTHEAVDEMKDWLEHLLKLNEEDSTGDIKDRFSWSGYHSKYLQLVQSNLPQRCYHFLMTV
eukprot:Seg771.7 transcript_id=Seg771.7/GoldUCD/mRNA.D3Y31 product="hypothetical protein" protein_id=Seg771.7/GoldUCD/D3Y31